MHDQGEAMGYLYHYARAMGYLYNYARAMGYLYHYARARRGYKVNKSRYSRGGVQGILVEVGCKGLSAVVGTPEL